MGTWFKIVGWEYQLFQVRVHISVTGVLHPQKPFFTGHTEPTCGPIVFALCIRSSWIFRVFFAFHFWRLVHLDAPLCIHSVLRAFCSPTPSLCLSLVFTSLSSCLLACCLRLEVARIRRPSLPLSHIWRPRFVIFHRFPSADILPPFFLSHHLTITCIIPLLFTRGLGWPAFRPPYMGWIPSPQESIVSH